MTARETGQPPLGPSREVLRRAWDDMHARRVPLARPVLILGGWRTPAWTILRLRRRLAALTSGREDDFHTLSFALTHSIEEAARLAVRRARAAPPGPLDVIGVSMGGVVARAAEAGVHDADDRLPITRLFTIGTPHRGARAAAYIALDPAARSMRPGSEMLRRLDERLAERPFELVPYARLRDGMVGARNAAPPGQGCLWATGPLALSHVTITLDQRIIADLARRLRGEPPLAGAPSDPPCH